MDFWTFFHEHWFLAWCALWLGCGAAWVVVSVVGVFSMLANRLLRTVKVVLRGWPPAHLDADGDWRPAPKSK